MSLEMKPIEVRVLGALMEKAVTTPEYYPLTLNSLTLACNQKTNRDPVSEYSEEEVLQALDNLRDMGLAMRVDVAGGRVPKYRHQIATRWELDEPTFAVLTILFLRGAQTPGQIRSRTERLYPFRDLPAIQETLEGMQQRPFEPTVLIQPLPLRPGSKEVRYHHVFCEPEDLLQESLDGAAASVSPRATIRMGHDDDLEELRSELSVLRDRVAALEEELNAFKSQF